VSIRKIITATCQFPVSSNIEKNAGYILDFIKEAADKDAEILHTPECALSGYACVDWEDFSKLDWDILRKCTLEIIQAAKEKSMWVVLASTHRLTKPNKPHNCMYLINPEGEIIDRYDKRFCTREGLKYYTPGDRTVIFELNGVRCALLICFDLRFPEIYRQLYKQGVECVFQSFYNARQKSPSVHTHIMRQTMQTRAAENGFWISMSNASGRYSPYPSCFIQPDGKIINQLKSNKSGMMINVVDLNETFYDPSADFRDDAIEGKLTNAQKQIDDPRAENRHII
jgi:predicted amidohydrolase